MDKRELVRRIARDSFVRPEVFIGAIISARASQSIRQEWALVRAIESLNYFDLTDFRMILIFSWIAADTFPPPLCVFLG